MVPLNILVGEDEFKDQVEISSEEFYERMGEATELPKTAQPAPFDFVNLKKSVRGGRSRTR